MDQNTKDRQNYLLPSRILWSTVWENDWYGTQVECLLIVVVLLLPLYVHCHQSIVLDKKIENRKPLLCFRLKNNSTSPHHVLFKPRPWFSYFKFEEWQKAWLILVLFALTYFISEKENRVGNRLLGEWYFYSPNWDSDPPPK